ncbi:uncharacterized protein LOC112572808 [Pomacea canaliculata]|nr:uncharacterized protein LOC112572808 [Pomacea canaliculata]
MTTWTVFNVSGAVPREPTIIDSDQTLPAHGGHVGRISGSVLGCAVFFGVIVSIGIIVARDYYRKRLMRNDTSTLKNVTFPDDGVDNKTHTTVEDTNDGQPVMPSPTFCARSKASTDKTRTIENLPTDGAVFTKTF